MRDGEKVVKIDLNGNFDIHKFEGYIRDFYVLENGDYYLIYESQSKLLLIDSFGKFREELVIGTELSIISDFKVSDDGKFVLLSEPYDPGNAVYVFDSELNLESNFGSTKDQPGQIASHETFSISPEGEIWYVDYDEFNATSWPINRRLVHLGSLGNHLNIFTVVSGEELTCEGFIVEALPDNRAALADPCTGQIYIIDENGETIEQWGSLGTQPGEFNLITQLFFMIAPEPLLYVVDSENNKIYSFDLGGNLIQEWEADEFDVISPIDIFVQPDGTIYLLDGESNSVVRYTPDGNTLKWKLPMGDFVNTIAVNPSESLVIVGGTDSYFYVFTTEGNLLGKQHVSGSRGTLVAFDPNGMAFASTGYTNIYLYELSEK